MANDFMGVVSGEAIPIAYKPSGWQTTAGVLLIMTCVLPLLAPIIAIFYSRYDNSFEMILTSFKIYCVLSSIKTSQNLFIFSIVKKIEINALMKKF